MVPRQTPMIIDTPASPMEARETLPAASGRLRARSLQWLDTFLHETRSRSSSASSRHSRSPDGVKDVIANLGLAAGTVGAEQIKPKRPREEDVLEGIRVFLSGFQNIVRRAGTGLDKSVVETIEVRKSMQRSSRSELTLHAGWRRRAIRAQSPSHYRGGKESL
jgi:hypothetical protein